MKTIVICICLAFCMPSLFAQDHNHDTEKTKKEIIIISTNSGSFDRSYLPSSVVAYLNETTQLVELELSNIGICNVYIVDSLGTISNQMQLDATDIQYVCFSYPSVSGYYRLIISSDVFYAEGIFYI